MTIWHFAKEDIPATAAMGDECLVGHLGIDFVAVGDDWIELRMPVDERTRQPYGNLHGGASAALAETISSFAGMLTLDPSRAMAVGLEINANHLRPVRDGWVHARATPELLGRNSQVWAVRITDESGKLVCVSRATLAIVPLPEKRPA